MLVFDRIDPEKLERRDTQLWVLAIAMIVILAAGIALLIYPTAFTMPVVVSGAFLKRIFFSFCVLSLLVVGYLMERRIVVSRLRARIRQEEQRARRMLNEASADLLATLPGMEHFRDRLAMEFRRATNAQLPLTLLLIRLSPSSGLNPTDEVLTAYGDAAKAILRKLRAEDSIYLFRPSAFGIVLPGVRAAAAQRIGRRLAEGLSDASGASNRFAFSLRSVSFPENAASAHEMEREALACVTEDERQRTAA
jgi:GGDEF domain-containing protein